MAFALPDLPYAPDALEPAIDAQTMEIHHDKHHGGYVKKLNAALKETDWGDTPIEDLLRRLDELPEEIRRPVRNNGGGHFNHSLFWKCLAPPSNGGGGTPSGPLADAINDAFGSFDKMKEDFAVTAAGRFGSGWAWLCLNSEGQLHIASTANQDSCFMPEWYGGLGVEHTPLVGLDVWEHAYYLKYQNRRAAYIDAWWTVVNWPQVARNLDRAREHTSLLSV
jgi:Fe-Mn family superoxide dismutase